MTQGTPSTPTHDAPSVGVTCVGVRGYPETHHQRHAYIKQHSCGNETQGDHWEKAYAA